MSEVILEIQDVHKYFGSNILHEGVNFKLNKGESLGLLGSSGTGKSVLLRTIIGLEYIDRGEIYFKNKRIDNLQEQELLKIRLDISYSFQNGALFDSLNVYDNIAFPLVQHSGLTHAEINKKVCKILELIDLKGKETLMPADLSGGMQKRVGMARSLILKPEIVLYDEPTAGLDPSNSKNIVSLMKRFKSRGQACIFVTHDIPSAIELCDRIIVLNQGKIIFSGTPKKFMESENKIIKNFRIHEDSDYAI